MIRALMFQKSRVADVAQLVEQLICNQPVGGSSPLIGSIKAECLIDFTCIWLVNLKEGIKNILERFPSGQRGQTVNLLAKPSKVRILPSPLYAISGSNSAGRVAAFQAVCRGFEPRLPLFRVNNIFCPRSSIGRAHPW